MSVVPPQASKLDATLQQAMLHHQAGRVAEAEKLYRRILRSKPESSRDQQCARHRAARPGQARRGGGRVQAGGVGCAGVCARAQQSRQRAVRAGQAEGGGGLLSQGAGVGAGHAGRAEESRSGAGRPRTLRRQLSVVPAARRTDLRPARQRRAQPRAGAAAQGAARSRAARLSQRHRRRSLAAFLQRSISNRARAFPAARSIPTPPAARSQRNGRASRRSRSSTIC